MARVSTILTNFRAGELSPKLFGRIDLQKYSEGCETLENMLVFPSGGITRRPGTTFAGRTKDVAKKVEEEKEEKEKKERRESFDRPTMADIAGKVIAEKKEDPEIKIKDNDQDGEVKEDSFDSMFNKQLSRLEKYLGSTNRETKGKVALALSDAVGTPGSLADKAAVLNKALLGIAETKKKYKR